MKQSSVQYIQVDNKTGFNFQLKIPSFGFQRTILPLQRYSLPLPFRFDSPTIGELVRADGAIFRFVMNQNGELSMVNSGLQIGTLDNGRPLDAFGLVSIGVDQFENNLLIIGASPPATNFPQPNLPFF